MRATNLVLTAAATLALLACGVDPGPNVGSESAAVAKGNGNDKVTICHVPPGNPGNMHLITVGAPAVAAHVANHGDGVCAANATECCPTAQGSLCTNFQTDDANCGACGHACPANAHCVGGVCVTPNPS